MKRKAFLLSVVLLSTVTALAVFTDSYKKIKASLTGYHEVPAVSTTGNAEFRGQINDDRTAVDWSLTYNDLEGAVQQAHVHIGNVGVNGGITVFLCTNLGNGPAGTQPCPAPPATISGTIVAADVSPNIPATQAARNQGLNTGEFDEFLDAAQAGVLYVNVHSTLWPGGEVRSQIDGHAGKHGGEEK